MDNQNNPFQPQNDNSQPDPVPQPEPDQNPQNSHGPASSEEVEAARAAFQAAMKQEYANSPAPQESSAPQNPQPQPETPPVAPNQDSVDSFQIPSMPPSETPQPPEQQQVPPTPPQPEESPHSIQNFTRRRHPGTEQATRMNPGGEQDATQPVSANQIPPRSVANGSGNKAPIPPPQETVINEAPHAPQQGPAPSSEAPGYVDNTHLFTQQQTNEQPVVDQSRQPSPPAIDPPAEPTPSEPTSNDWHIKPAFSQGVIGVGEQNPPATADAPQQVPATATPETPPQIQTPAVPTEPAPTAQPVQPPTHNPNPAQANEQGSFQLPQVPPAESNLTPQAPNPETPPAPAATLGQAPAALNPQQSMPEVSQPTTANTEDATPKSRGVFAQYFGKLKSINYKPFVSAGLMGMAVFAVFNSQVLLGQIQYITTPSGGVETTGVVSGESAVGNENKIIIPKINVDVPVVYDIKTFDEDAVQEGLERGVVHYGTTAMPGEIGNNVIVGHSSNNWWDSGEYKFAFILLDRLDDGDEIILHYEGTRYVYEVTRSLVVNPTDVSVLEQGDDSILTLITCTPPGTSWQRLIVQAEQVTPDPSENVGRGVDREIPRELPSDLPRDNTGGFMEFMRGLF